MGLLCYSDDFSGVVGGLLTPSLLDPYYSEIARQVLNYRESHKKCPGAHTLDLVTSLKEQFPDHAPIYEEIYQSILETKDGLNAEYLLKRATSFVKHQKMKRGISRAVDLLQRGDETSVAEAERELRSSLSETTELFDPGILLQDATKSLAFLDRSYEAFPTGIERIDSVALGPGRKRLHLFVALTGQGKSWWCVNLAKNALIAGLKVAYVSLELDAEEVCKRLIQSFFSVSQWDREVYYPLFERDELGRFLSLASRTVTRPNFSDTNIRPLLEEKLEGLARRPPVYVRQFPTGSLTMRELEGYLDGLEAGCKFIPDLLIVDYPDLMSFDATDYRISVGQVYKKLRGIAIERNMAVAAVSQAHRAAKGASVLTEASVAEDFSKVQTADVVITYNQTIDEYELGLARLFVAKGRTAADKFTVLISQAYGIGQFVMDSVGMVSSYWEHIRRERDEEDAE